MTAKWCYYLADWFSRSSELTGFAQFDWIQKRRNVYPPLIAKQ